MRVWIVAALVLAVAAFGCSSGDLDELSRDVGGLSAQVAVVEAKVDNLDREPVDLSAWEERFNSLEDQLSHITQLVEEPIIDVVEQPVVVEVPAEVPDGMMVIPTWEPGTTLQDAQANLDACLDTRVTSVMGPLGAAMGSEFAGMFDLFESFDDIPVGSDFPGDEDGVFTIWIVGSMLGCWTGDLR